MNPKNKSEHTQLAIANNFKSLRDIAVETVRGAIIQGHFKSGDHLKERDLAKEMGISTTPIKEAFRILSHEGLVETIPRKGTYVSTMVDSSIEEILLMRSYLEGMTARLAAAKATDEELMELEQQMALIEQMKIERNPDRYFQENTNFHLMVRRMAKNPILSQTLTNIENIDFAFRKRALEMPEEIENGFIEHRLVFEAIKNRDPELAEERMKNHIMRTAQHVLYQKKE